MAALRFPRMRFPGFGSGGSSFVKLSLAVGFIGFSLEQSVYTVEPGHRAVIFDRLKGVKDDVINEGAHFRIPILEVPHSLDVRTTARSYPTNTGTKDLQNVQLQLRVLCRPDVQHLPMIFKQLGANWDERVMPGISNEVMKAVVAQYDAAELLTKRDQVSNDIRRHLHKRAAEFHIDLQDVSLVQLFFSKEFSKAIEDKQVAEQQAERAKFVVMKAEQEREANVIRAEGDAEAARLVSDAIAKHGKGLIEMRRIETAQHIASALSQNPNVQYLPSGGGNGLLLNLNK